MLCPALTSELQQIFLEEYGLELSQYEATQTGESLVRVFQTLASISTSMNHPNNDTQTLSSE